MGYEAYVRLADHEWTFTRDDASGETTDGVTVLDGLAIGWLNTGRLWPAQPGIMTAALALNVPDFVDAAVLQNEVCVIEVKADSAGDDPIARFYGDITDARATTRTKRPGVTISVIAVDYRARVAEDGSIQFRELDVGGGADPLYEHQVAGMLWEQFGNNPDDDVTDIWTSPTPRLMYGISDPYLPPVGTFLDTATYLDALLTQAIDADDLTRMIWSPLVNSDGELPTDGSRTFTLDTISSDLDALAEVTIPGNIVRLDQLQWSDVKGSNPGIVRAVAWSGDAEIRKDSVVETAIGQSEETIPVILTGADDEDNVQAVADFYAAPTFDRWQLDKITVEVTRAVNDGRLDPDDVPHCFPNWKATEGGGFRAACYSQLITVTDVDTTRTPDAADTISGVLTGATCLITGGALSLDLIVRRTLAEEPPPDDPTWAEIIMTDAPIGWWRLGEASGATAFDDSGNGHDGTYSGSISLGVPGLLTSDTDTCADFASGYVEIPYFSALNATGHFSAEAIINADNVTGDHEIVQHDDDASPSSELHFRMRVSNGKLVTFGTVGGVTGATTLSTGVDYHVVATYDGTYFALYVNGVLDGTSTSAPGLNLASTEALYIGSLSRFSSERFDGRIDEVAVYDYALTPTQILDHYNASIA